MANPFDYSVVIPCRNGDRTLGRALAHIGRLSPSPREIVVVDDASADGTRATAVAAGARVVHFTEPVGAPRVRNAGGAAANSRWLLFVDSDCYVTPGGFLEAVRLLQANDRLAGVMGVFATVAPSGPFAGGYKNYFRHLEIAAMRNPPPSFTSSCFLIEREAFLRVGGFNEAYGRVPTEDNELYFRLVKDGCVIPYLVAFEFVHDKPMGLWRLFTEDATRAAAIIVNLLGCLGEPGRGWSPGEKTTLALEVFGGILAAALPVALVLWFAGVGGAGALVLAGAGGCVILAGLLGDKLRRAWRDRGLWFAARLYLYRVVEMVAAAVGIVTGLGRAARRGFA